MNGYSRYATEARAKKEEEERIAANREGRSPQPVDVNYIGPARTRFAARQGRSRTAGYSAIRQGDRNAARARAEERTAGAFKRLNESRARSFGGLKEYDKMQKSKNFARVKTPALDAHFGKKNSVVSSDPRGAYDPRKGPQGRIGAVGEDTKVDPADDMNNRVNKDIGAADFPSDVAGFDEVKKGQRGPFSMLTQRGRVKGFATFGPSQPKTPPSQQAQSKPTPAPFSSPKTEQPRQVAETKPASPPPTQRPKPVAPSKTESRQPSVPVQKPIASAKQPTAEEPKMPPLGIGGKIAIKAGDIIAETARGAKVMFGGKDPGDIRTSYRTGLDEREKTWNGIYKPGKPTPFDFFKRNPE